MSALIVHLGGVLKTMRAERGWSQEKLAELAELAGLDRSYVGQIERAVVSPTLATLEKLAGALQTSPSELICMNSASVQPKKLIAAG